MVTLVEAEKKLETCGQYVQQQLIKQNDRHLHYTGIMTKDEEIVSDKKEITSIAYVIIGETKGIPVLGLLGIGKHTDKIAIFRINLNKDSQIKDSQIVTFHNDYKDKFVKIIPEVNSMFHTNFSLN